MIVVCILKYNNATKIFNEAGNLLQKDTWRAKNKQQMHNVSNKLAQKDSIEKQLTSGFSDFPTFTVFFCQFSPKAHNTQWTKPRLCLTLSQLIGTGVFKCDLWPARHTEHCQHKVKKKKKQNAIKLCSEPAYKVNTVKLVSSVLLDTLVIVLTFAQQLRSGISVVGSAAEILSEIDDWKIGLDVLATLSASADVCNFLRSLYCSACGKTLSVRARPRGSMGLRKLRLLEGSTPMDIIGLKQRVR